MRLLLMSDTHVPRRARALPDLLWSEVERADVVVHAGDWVVPELLDELGGLRVAVVHETGPSTGRDARMAALYPDADLLVFGHSHVPWDAEHHRAAPC